MISRETYVHVNDVVVDTWLILFQHFEESVHVFTGGEELQVSLDLNQEN